MAIPGKFVEQVVNKLLLLFLATAPGTAARVGDISTCLHVLVQCHQCLMVLLQEHTKINRLD